MSVLEHLERMGGVAARATLVRVCSRAAVDAALAAGDLTVLARGRYALPQAEEAVLAAHRLSGVVSHLSAAQRWGWEVRLPPDLPDVTVPKGRKLGLDQRRGVRLHRADLFLDDIRDGVTSRERTLLDCLRTQPYLDALAVADSALRHGVPCATLATLARDARGPGGAQVRRVADASDGRAANPFESALRGICHGVDGLSVRPQAPIYEPDFIGRPDLVDTDLRIVLEADPFQWHGDRGALRRDCRRYYEFVSRGWVVLRFAWEDVMFDADWVRGILRAVVAERTHRPCACSAPA